MLEDEGPAHKLKNEMSESDSLEGGGKEASESKSGIGDDERQPVIYV